MSVSLAYVAHRGESCWCMFLRSLRLRRLEMHSFFFFWTTTNVDWSSINAGQHLYFVTKKYHVVFQMVIIVHFWGQFCSPIDVYTSCSVQNPYIPKCTNRWRKIGTLAPANHLTFFFPLIFGFFFLFLFFCGFSHSEQKALLSALYYRGRSIIRKQRKMSFITRSQRLLYISFI